MHAVIRGGPAAEPDAPLPEQKRAPPTWNLVLARNVRQLRRARGVSQETLAQECGIFRSYLSRIENGVANPSLSVLTALANACNTTPPMLLTPMA